MTRQSYRLMQAVQFRVLFLASTFRSKYRRVVIVSLRPPSLRNEPPIFTGEEVVVISRKLHTIRAPGHTKRYGDVEDSEKRPWPIKNSPSLGTNESDLT